MKVENNEGDIVITMDRFEAKILYTVLGVMSESVLGQGLDKATRFIGDKIVPYTELEKELLCHEQYRLFSILDNEVRIKEKLVK